MGRVPDERGFFTIDHNAPPACILWSGALLDRHHAQLQDPGRIHRSGIYLLHEGEGKGEGGIAILQFIRSVSENGGSVQMRPRPHLDAATNSTSIRGTDWAAGRRARAVCLILRG